MCGIVGGISRNINRAEAEKMRDMLYRRGPDDKGLFFDDKQAVFLGQRRLSIIDLSDNAKQPMIINNLVISYNGEVYNFKEIKKELEIKGYKFKSDSDTEVVLVSYIEWGLDCVKKFRGMFAFSIWDSKKEKIFLFRDRFGVKPLYYYFNNEDFVFASELKAIYSFSEFKKEIDFDSLSMYFRLGYIPAPKSIFKNVFKLESGTILEVDKKLNIKKHKYWNPENLFLQEKIQIDEKTALNELEEILQESFNYRMVADVDVGIFLSGGIDSSLVAALLSKRHENLKTFTVGFEDQDYNEANYAKEIAKILGTDHYEYYISNFELEESLESFIDIFDEPFGDSSAIPTYLLSKFTKNEVKVALSGDGGDEIFFGYSKYEAIEKVKNLPNLLKFMGSKSINIIGPDNIAKIYSQLSGVFPFLSEYSNLPEKIFKLEGFLKGGDLSELFSLAGTYWKDSEISQLLKSNFNNIELYQKSDLDFREQMQIWDIGNYLQNDILVKTDRASMAVGLESREPYLDHRVLEYFAKLPFDIKYHKGESKRLLKKILFKHLPENLFDRPKTGFKPPINKWLKSGNFDQYLDLAKIKRRGILNPEPVKVMLDEYRSGKYINPDKVWILVAFEMWADKWL